MWIDHVPSFVLTTVPHSLDVVGRRGVLPHSGLTRFDKLQLLGEQFCDVEVHISDRKEQPRRQDRC